MKTLMNIYQFIQDINMIQGIPIKRYFINQPDILMTIFKNRQALGVYKNGERLFELSFDINNSRATLYDYNTNGYLGIHNMPHRLPINTDISHLDNLNLRSIKYIKQLFEEIPDAAPELTDGDLEYTSVITMDGYKQGFEFSYAIIAKDDGAVILYLRNSDVAIISKNKRLSDQLFILDIKICQTKGQAYEKWRYLIGKLSEKQAGKYFINLDPEENITNRDFLTKRIREFIKKAEKDIGHLIGNDRLC